MQFLREIVRTSTLLQVLPTEAKKAARASIDKSLRVQVGQGELHRLIGLRLIGLRLILLRFAGIRLCRSHLRTERQSHLRSDERGVTQGSIFRLLQNVA